VIVARNPRPAPFSRNRQIERIGARLRATITGHDFPSAGGDDNDPFLTTAHDIALPITEVGSALKEELGSVPFHALGTPKPNLCGSA
jgi:hypothetical protein